MSISCREVAYLAAIPRTNSLGRADAGATSSTSFARTLMARSNGSRGWFWVGSRKLARNEETRLSLAILLSLHSLAGASRSAAARVGLKNRPTRQHTEPLSAASASLSVFLLVLAAAAAAAAAAALGCLLVSLLSLLLFCSCGLVGVAVVLVVVLDEEEVEEALLVVVGGSL